MPKKAKAPPQRAKEAPPDRYRLEFTKRAVAEKSHLERTDPKKHKKVLKTLGLLESNPAHPGLNGHKYASLYGPSGEEVWECYVENRTPAAYRLFYCYKKGARGVIIVVAITPHP